MERRNNSNSVRQLSVGSSTSDLDLWPRHLVNIAKDVEQMGLSMAMGIPQDGSFIGKFLLKWDDDWGYPHLWKPPNVFVLFWTKKTNINTTHGKQEVQGDSTQSSYKSDPTKTLQLCNILGCNWREPCHGSHVFPVY